MNSSNLINDINAQLGAHSDTPVDRSLDIETNRLHASYIALVTLGLNLELLNPELAAPHLLHALDSIADTNVTKSYVDRSASVRQAFVARVIKQHSLDELSAELLERGSTQSKSPGPDPVPNMLRNTILAKTVEELIKAGFYPPSRNDESGSCSKEEARHPDDTISCCDIVCEAYNTLLDEYFAHLEALTGKPKATLQKLTNRKIHFPTVKKAWVQHCAAQPAKKSTRSKKNN